MALDVQRELEQAHALLNRVPIERLGTARTLLEDLVDRNKLGWEGLKIAIFSSLSGMQQVRSILTEKVEDSVLVWIVVDDPKPGIRKQVYEKELELISRFPEANFDFNLISTMGQSSCEMSSTAEIIYSRPS